MTSLIESASLSARGLFTGVMSLGFPSGSVTRKATVPAAVDGFSDAVRYWTDRRAAWSAARPAGRVSVRVPAEDEPVMRPGLVKARKS